MQVTETVSEGLKRQLKVIVPAADLKARVESKLEDLQTKVRLNGFRPGKVPLAHVRQLYGRSVMAEVLEQAVGETSTKALQDRQERPAFQPDIKLPEDEATVERIIEGASDLEYTMSFEILPKIQLADLKSIELEKEVAEPADEDVQKQIDRLMQRIGRPGHGGARLHNVFAVFSCHLFPRLPPLPHVPGRESRSACGPAPY